VLPAVVVLVVMAVFWGWLHEVSILEDPRRDKIDCTAPDLAGEPFCNRADAIVMLLCGDQFVKSDVGDHTLASIHEHALEEFPHLHLFVLTCEAACLESYPLFQHPRIHVLPVSPDALPGNPEFMEPMHYKAVKTQIFDVLPRTTPVTGRPITRVLYVDADVVLTRLFPSWLQNLPHIFYDADRHDKDAVVANGRTCQMGMLPERAYVKNEWQSGVLYLHRQQSLHCLRAWGNNIESGRFHYDQDAYDATPECSDVRCAIGVAGDAIYTRDFHEVLVGTLHGLLPSTRAHSRAPFVHYTGAAHRADNPCDHAAFSFSCFAYRVNRQSFQTVRQRACPYAGPVSTAADTVSGKKGLQRQHLRAGDTVWDVSEPPDTKQEGP